MSQFLQVVIELHFGDIAQQNQLQHTYSTNRNIVHDVNPEQSQQPTSSSSIQVISAA